MMITSGLVQRGLHLETAQRAATSLLGRAIEAQSAMEAFGDAYFLIALLFVGLLPLGLLIARHAPGKHSMPE